jgi:hypothetical protein
MRRWLCMVVLLFALAGQGAALATRVPEPVPIERLLSAWRGGRLQRTSAWWDAS